MEENIFSKKDLKIIQMAVGYAQDVIRYIATENGVQTHELENRGYKRLSDVFYEINALWLEIQRELNGGEL